jgi:hypothetical protein
MSTDLRRRLQAVEQAARNLTKPHPKKLDEAMDAWDFAQANLCRFIWPDDPRGAQDLLTPDSEHFREALHELVTAADACGATLLRAIAKAILLGYFELDWWYAHYRKPPAQTSAEVRRMAYELDRQGTPDLSAYWYDAPTYEADPESRLTKKAERPWTWRERLDAIRRYHAKHPEQKFTEMAFYCMPKTWARRKS